MKQPKEHDYIKFPLIYKVIIINLIIAGLFGVYNLWILGTPAKSGATQTDKSMSHHIELNQSVSGWHTWALIAVNK